MNRTILILAAAALALAASFAAAQGVPGLVNYQGTLTDAAGQPITGDHNLEFNIYDATIGGALVWGPQSFLAVPFDVQGRFNVILGPEDSNMNPLTNAFARGGDRFLEITVDGGTPIAPRQQFLSTPYSFRAQYGAPTGSITAYAGPETPEGWLLCDGSAVSREVYADLFAAIGETWGAGDGVTTFNLPALVPNPMTGSMSRFLRGGAPGEASYQEDATALPETAFQTDIGGYHAHYWRGSYYLHDPDGGDSHVRSRDWRSTYGNYQTTDHAGSHAHTITSGGDSETRPINAAVNWIIKI